MASRPSFLIEFFASLHTDSSATLEKTLQGWTAGTSGQPGSGVDLVCAHLLVMITLLILRLEGCRHHRLWVGD